MVHCSAPRYTVLAHKVISVPPDAPPCCPQRSHPTPLSYSSESSSQVSTPLQTEGSNLVAMDHNSFSLESTNSLFHLSRECNAMDLFPLQDETSQNSLGLRLSDLRSNSGPELGSIFSPPELVDMSELDGPGLSASSSTSGLAPGKGDFDGVPLSLDTEIGEWGMDQDDNGSTGTIAPTTSGKLRAHASDNAAKHVMARHSRGSGTGEEIAGSDSRITITIDDAEPETVMGVMQVLVQSTAKVEFHRG